MLKKVVTVLKDPFAIFLALLFTGLFFSVGYRPEVAETGQLARLLKFSGGVFILFLVAFSILCSTVRRHLAHERDNLHAGESGGVLLWMFVLYKEAVKTVFGVSMTLGWMAGMLFLVDYFRDVSLVVPLLLALPLSALAFLPAYFFTSLLDHIPYPLRN